jgi:thiopeptide-type bacteriocin biosynthesis protein
MTERSMTADAFAPSGFFVLRTPLLPFSEFTAWGDGLQAAAHVDNAERLGDAVARDRLRLRQRLMRILARPDFREAVFLASPSLDGAIDVWRSAPNTRPARSAERSLVSYFSRATGRSTPFGLLAGCTTGTIGGRTRLQLEGRERYRRHSRLDMELLWSLAETIERDPRLRGSLVYRPNTSLYDSGQRLLYAEAAEEHGRRTYRLVAIDKTPYLTATLARSSGGERLDVLAAALVDGDITPADAEQYLDELVDHQILCADVRPQLTGAAPTATLIRTLASCAQTAPLAERLDDARRRLAALDREALGASPDRYRAVARALDGLPVSPELSRLVQVDLTKRAKALSLAPHVVAEIVRGVRALHAFTRARPPVALSRFREEFVRRYDGREVPLVEALDEDNGIGFERSTAAGAEAAHLLAGLQLNEGRDQSAVWTGRDALLLDKLTDALGCGSREIAIDAAELPRESRVDVPPLPDAFEAVVSLAATSEEAVDRGDFRVVVQSASGPPGARLFGRFCHLDGSLRRFVGEHLRAEEANRPDCVFAEIVHLPEGRAGNILSRPVLRAYEIPYLGHSGAPADRQIRAGDLVVSVRGDRIVLRSRRLGREVIPRLTTAHNHAWRSLGLYRFLCTLQHQGVVPGLVWDWGPLGQVRFLPRVVSGRAVLSKARWNLDAGELAAFGEGDERERFAAVHALRADRGIPRYVALVDGESELPADLENVLSIDALAHHLERRSSAALVELLPGPDGMCASGPEGAFAHQIVMPFVRSPAATWPTPPRSVAAGSVPRRFPPGSDWLYVKLFTGTSTAERVLDAAARVVQASLRAKIADRWFFIRYGDPDWHLRLRVHGDRERLLHEVLPALNAIAHRLVDAGHVWRVELDTYERELERYGGGQAIELAERIFHADSDAVLAILRAVHGDRGAGLRWRAALAGIDVLLEDFGFTVEHKRAIARRARDGYGSEFGAGRAFQRQLSRRYRDERAGLEAVLDRASSGPPAFRPIVDALRARSAAIAPLVGELRKLADDDRLSAPLDEIAMSLAHMHVNRILRSAPRVQELVLYELLDRLYTSQAARDGG